MSATLEGDGPWICGGTSGGGNRRIHIAADCQHVQRANNIRLADDVEIARFPVCQSPRCGGDPTPAGRGDGHYESLVDAEPEDIPTSHS